MDLKNKKCVVIIDEDLPIGLIANTSMIMGLSLGKLYSELIGVDVIDKSNQQHLGITSCPIPILKGNRTLLHELRSKANQLELTIVDFCNVAQYCKDYDDYIDRMSQTGAKDLSYLGITLYGDKKAINRLTGSIPLLR